MQPLSLYAETKVEVERHLRDVIDDRLNWTILRFATVYGVSPRLRLDLTVNDFTAHAPGSTFTVRVRTSDVENPARFLEQDFVLTLAAAQAPTAIQLTATSVSSTALARTLVGQLGTTDANTLDAHDYALVPGAGDTDNGLFSIDGAWLQIAAPIPSSPKDRPLDL